MSKIITISELRRKSAAERTALVGRLRGQLREALFARQDGSLRKVRTIRVLRRSIAKVLTIKS